MPKDERFCLCGWLDAVVVQLNAGLGMLPFEPPSIVADASRLLRKVFGTMVLGALSDGLGKRRTLQFPAVQECLGWVA